MKAGIIQNKAYRDHREGHIQQTHRHNFGELRHFFDKDEPLRLMPGVYMEQIRDNTEVISQDIVGGRQDWALQERNT